MPPSAGGSDFSEQGKASQMSSSEGGNYRNFFLAVFVLPGEAAVHRSPSQGFEEVLGRGMSESL